MADFGKPCSATTVTLTSVLIPDGSIPIGVVASQTMLYGAMNAGGDFSGGTLYEFNFQGTGYQVLHSFSGTDGSGPVLPTLVGSVIYGATQEGGGANDGVIYRVNNDGTGFQTIHSFTGGALGKVPNGPVTVSGSTIYGTTAEGGSGGDGTVYSINTDGTNYQVLHSFHFSDGENPLGSLLQIGSTLYGMAQIGGANNSQGNGVVFAINTDGSGFRLLHSFSGGLGRSSNDGDNPHSGSLIAVGSTLFGTTWDGGQSNPARGTVFEVNTDGSGFELLHSFSGFPSDGALPTTPVALFGSMLVGTTSEAGGMTPFSAIYEMNTDGTGYQLLYPSGLRDASGITFVGSTGYFTTEDHGDSLDFFTATVPEPSSFVLVGFAAIILMLWSVAKRSKARA